MHNKSRSKWSLCLPLILLVMASLLSSACHSVFSEHFNDWNLGGNQQNKQITNIKALNEKDLLDLFPNTTLQSKYIAASGKKCQIRISSNKDIADKENINKDFSDSAFRFCRNATGKWFITPVNNPVNILTDYLMVDEGDLFTIDSELLTRHE